MNIKKEQCFRIVRISFHSVVTAEDHALDDTDDKRCKNGREHSADARAFGKIEGHHDHRSVDDQGEQAECKEGDRHGDKLQHGLHEHIEQSQRERCRDYGCVVGKTDFLQQTVGDEQCNAVCDKCAYELFHVAHYSTF